jgi:hypothetical protein
MQVEVLKDEEFYLVWEKLPEESDEEYAAFKTYVEMRSKNDTAPLGSVARTTGIKHKDIKEMAQRHKWNERWLAYAEDTVQKAKINIINNLTKNLESQIKAAEQLRRSAEALLSGIGQNPDEIGRDTNALTMAMKAIENSKNIIAEALLMTKELVEEKKVLLTGEDKEASKVEAKTEWENLKEMVLASTVKPKNMKGDGRGCDPDLCQYQWAIGIKTHTPLKKPSEIEDEVLKAVYEKIIEFWKNGIFPTKASLVGFLEPLGVHSFDRVLDDPANPKHRAYNWAWALWSKVEQSNKAIGNVHFAARQWDEQSKERAIKETEKIGMAIEVSKMSQYEAIGKDVIAGLLGE